MAQMTKAELQNLLDQVEEKLTDALDPELSREQLVAQVKEALEIVESDDEEEEEDQEQDEDED